MKTFDLSNAIGHGINWVAIWILVSTLIGMVIPAWTVSYMSLYEIAFWGFGSILTLLGCVTAFFIPAYGTILEDDKFLEIYENTIKYRKKERSENNQQLSHIAQTIIIICAILLGNMSLAICVYMALAGGWMITSTLSKFVANHKEKYEKLKQKG